MFKTYFICLLLSFFTLFLNGCASSKEINYFQAEEDQSIDGDIVAYEPLIQVGDILVINVASITPGAAEPFNVYEAGGNGVQRNLPYIVDAEGEIDFPAIGKFKIAGLTTKEVSDQLHEKLLPFLKDPIINIRITNFKITVLGEVKNPGSYTIQNERITILEALGLAGDLNLQAKRSPVLLIREQNGKRTSYEVDLTSKKLFSSPYFYLTQNDVIYVQPNKARVNSSAVSSYTAVILSSITVIISLAAIFLR